MAISVKDLINLLIEHCDPDAILSVDTDGRVLWEPEIDIGVPAGAPDGTLYLYIDKADTQTDDENRSEVDDAIKLACSILDDIAELPEAAEDFSEGVRETTDGILTYVERNGRVSDKQKQALDNMREGVDKWLDPDNYR